MSSEPVEVDVSRLAEAWHGGCVVVDVREPDEYAAGHVPGAHLVPLGDLPARIDDVPSSARLHVICASGQRSLHAVRWLQAQGYDAVSVAGGTLAWVAAGLPVEP